MWDFIFIGISESLFFVCIFFLSFSYLLDVMHAKNFTIAKLCACASLNARWHVFCQIIRPPCLSVLLLWHSSSFSQGNHDGSDGLDFAQKLMVQMGLKSWDRQQRDTAQTWPFCDAVRWLIPRELQELFCKLIALHGVLQAASWLFFSISSRYDPY